MKIDQKNLKIDVFRSEDLNELVKVFSFPWTSFEATKAKWETYLSEQRVGDRIVCVAKWKDQFIKKKKGPGLRSCDSCGK